MVQQGIGYTPTSGGTDWAQQSSQMGSDPCQGLQGRKKTQCRQAQRQTRNQGGQGGGRHRGGQQTNVLDTTGSRRSSQGAPTSQLPTAGGQYNPGGGQAQAAQPTGNLDRAAQTARMTAPAGSFAAGLGEVTGLPMAAEDPNAMAANFFSQQYGLPYGSQSQSLATQYLDPTQKVLGILGEIPGNYIDAVNFGASLWQTSGTGMQLSPTYMIQNIVSGIQNAQAGDPSSVGTDPFGAIKSMPNPMDGVDMLLSTLSGALVGTMPEDAFNNYINSLRQFAYNAITKSGGMMNQSLSEFAGAEGSGGHWFDQLVSQLGPTLGL